MRSCVQHGGGNARHYGAVDVYKERVQVWDYNTVEAACATQCSTSCIGQLPSASSVEAFATAGVRGGRETGWPRGMRSYVNWLSIVDQCKQCAPSLRIGVNFSTSAETENVNIIKMSLFDFVSLILASLIVALTMTREVRDMNIGQMMTMQRLDDIQDKKKADEAKGGVHVRKWGGPLSWCSSAAQISPARGAAHANPTGNVETLTRTARRAVTKMAEEVKEMADDVKEMAEDVVEEIADAANEVVADVAASRPLVHFGDAYEMTPNNKTLRYLLGASVFFRRYVILTEVGSTVVLLVTRFGGDSVSIMLNTFAALFMLELDNLAFDYGLTSHLKAEAEKAFKVELGAEQIWLLNLSRRWHVTSMTIFFVLFINCSANYDTIWDRQRACSLILIGLVAVGELIELCARWKRRSVRDPMANVERSISFLLKVALACLWKWYVCEFQFRIARIPFIYH